MSENTKDSETIYQVEDSKPNRVTAFLKTRAAKVSAITVGAALALAASFGVGVLAGEKLAHNGVPAFGQGSPFGPGHGFEDGDHRPPGGPGHDDDNGGFQVPNNTAPVNPSPVPTTTP